MNKPLLVVGNHECEILEKFNAGLNGQKIDIQKLNDGAWYWMCWNKKRNTADGIAYCPYCGQKL